MPGYQTLLADATQLSIEDRLLLIDAIWESLPEECLPPLSGEWTAEIRRRSAEYDSGAAKTLPWEEVKAEALDRVRRATPDAPD